MPKQDFAIVSPDSMEAVIAAVRLRRAGHTVVTYLSGNEKRQRKKAMADARSTLTPAEAGKLFTMDTIFARAFGNG